MLSGARIRESLDIATPASVRNAAVAGLQTALAVLIAVVATHMSPWEHLEGYPALGALAALFGRFASARRRMHIVMVAALLLTASVGSLSLIAQSGATPTAMLLYLALAGGLLAFLTARWQLGGPGAVIFVFAACAALEPAESWRIVGERTLLTGVGATVAWLVCLLTDSWRAKVLAPTPAVAAEPARNQLIAAARITFSGGLAALLAAAAGWSHPGWAAIGAIAVMQGSHLHITMHRAVQRTIGTIVGAVIAWAILANYPSFWIVLLAVIFFQLLTELVIGFNYAFAQICITPMALLMASLAAPASVDGMPMARVLDTTLGAVVGIVCALIFSTLDDRAQLAAHHAKQRES